MNMLHDLAALADLADPADPAHPGDGADTAHDDLSTLAWVHDELRRSLEAAHKALRRHLKEAQSLSGSDVDAVDPAVLRGARAQLHQAIGALQMVGLPGPARVLQASEAAVQRFIARPKLLTREAFAAVEAGQRRRRPQRHEQRRDGQHPDRRHHARLRRTSARRRRGCRPSRRAPRAWRAWTVGRRSPHLDRDRSPRARSPFPRAGQTP